MMSYATVVIFILFISVYNDFLINYVRKVHPILKNRPLLLVTLLLKLTWT